MIGGILRIIAKTFAVLIGMGGLMNVAKLPASLQDSREEAIATALAVLVAIALAWWLWRIGSREPGGKSSSFPPPDA